jgi:SAM-dependent methyltransferase
MSHKKIKYCRNCKSKKIDQIVNLGNQALTGKFPNSKSHSIRKTPLILVICNKCKLVQLYHSLKNSFLYNLDYGYETGINNTMRNHMKQVVQEIKNLKNLKKDDIILDIASNDGTLLNNFSRNLITIGIDPILNRFKEKYKKINFKISKFFSFKEIKKLKLQKKIDVITAFSVFYDLDDPNKFLQDIKSSLDKKGIFIMEQSNLALMIKQNSFDTVCQEHSCYYSLKVIKNMLKKNKLKLFDHKFNDINGGSSRYYITHANNSSLKINQNNISNSLKFEAKYNLENKSTYKKLLNKIGAIKFKTINKINNILAAGETIHGYGASTKGNVILQYFGINNNQIKYIADRNPFKYNKFTPGTKIKIISENKSRKLKPDYFLVLPWHFKKEILNREKSLRKKGTKLIFPLPTFKIY